MDNAPNADLHIPEPNIFIPTDFTLHTPKEEANLISLFKEKKKINHLLWLQQSNHNYLIPFLAVHITLDIIYHN